MGTGFVSFKSPDVELNLQPGLRTTVLGSTSVPQVSGRNSVLSESGRKEGAWPRKRLTVVPLLAWQLPTDNDCFHLMPTSAGGHKDTNSLSHSPAHKESDRMGSMEKHANP